MNEQRIIAAALADREAYDKLELYNAVGDLSAVGKHWYGKIQEYYERDPNAQRADRALVKDLGLQSANDRQTETLAGYFDALPSEVSVENVLVYLLQVQKASCGFKLAHLLADPASDQDKVSELLEEYGQLLEASKTGLVRLEAVDFDTLAEAYDPSNVIQLYPKQLSARCMSGGALPGHHILIYGRPEAGKSLFAINMACGIAYQGKKVVYLGNEEGIKSHATRAACNLARANISDYKANSEEINRRARTRGLDNLLFAKMEPGTLGEIEQWAIRHQPAAIVVDQLPGIDVRGERDPVRSVDKAARGFRTICLKHNLVGISVTQAGDKTERYNQEVPAYLGMGDVYGSRTGLPAQVDMMIGIGFDREMYEQDIRAVSLPKNKIGGNHEPFQIRIDSQQSRVRSLG